MSAPDTVDQIAFQYRREDSATGVTRDTARRIAARLGVDESQAIHLALRDMAVRVLPQYFSDDDTLTASQVRQIRK
jgi:hypothetical protein